MIFRCLPLSPLTFNAATGAFFVLGAQLRVFGHCKLQSSLAPFGAILLILSYSTYCTHLKTPCGGLITLGYVLGGLSAIR